MQTYNTPEIDAEVRDLMPESAGGLALGPETPVVVIHRGRHVIVDKFDGRDYRIMPGYTRMPYGAARHFQARQVIPGTRNPEIGTQQSYLGIPGVDDAWMCEPLTEEELQRFGAAIEAIDRSAFSDPADREVKTIPLGGTRNQRGNGGKRPQINTRGQATDAAAEAAERMFEKPETNDAKDAAASIGVVDELLEDAPPAPAPKKGRK